MPIRALIIEDEMPAARRLKGMVEAILPEIKIFPPIESVVEAVTWLSRNPKLDLIFMDVHLADQICFPIFDQVVVSCPVIFVSAFRQFALKAFRVNSIGYLQKPVNQEELKLVLEKFMRIYSLTEEHDLKPKATRTEDHYLNKPEKRFLVKIGKKMRVVQFSEIAYFFTRDKTTFLSLLSGKQFPVDYYLDEIEQMANPRHFFRVNRQYLIGIQSIFELSNSAQGKVKLNLIPACKEEVFVSSGRSTGFKLWFEGVFKAH